MILKRHIIIWEVIIVLFPLFCPGQTESRGVGIFTGYLGNVTKASSDILNDSEFENLCLFKINEKYYLKLSKLHVETGYNDCEQDSVQHYVTDNEEDYLFLFTDFKKYNKKGMESVVSERKEIYPGEKISFKFGRKHYELHASGEIDNGDINNYIIFFSYEGAKNKQTLVSIPKVASTVGKLVFIGDLDDDGKPDIILDASHHYEFVKIMLFLSSTAKKNNLVQWESEDAYWSDC